MYPYMTATLLTQRCQAADPQADLSLSAESSFLLCHTGACPHSQQYPAFRASID